MQLVLDEIDIYQNSFEYEKKISSQKYYNLNHKLNKLNNFTLDYNPIADKSVIINSEEKSKKMFVFFFSIVGLLISLIIITIKTLLIKKSSY